MLAQLVNHHFVRYAAVAAALAASAPLYAQPAEEPEAYYIDPAKRRERKEREEPQADSPMYVPASPPTPQYLRPAPQAEEKKLGKGWAWTLLVGGVITTAIGTQLSMTVCQRGTIPLTGEYVDECRTNNYLKYITMGGGILLGGLGLWGVLE